MERIQKQILGFNVDLFSFKDAVNYIADKMENGVGAQVVTINPEMIQLAQNDTRFASILSSADLVIPDGVGIKIALKFKGISQEQIPGIEFAKSLIAECEAKKYTVALVGASQEVLEQAISNLKNEFPNLKIVYSRNGFFNESDENKLIAELMFKSPNLVLVATGVPKQEYFINKYKNMLPHSVFIGVGGSFDVWAGHVQRAPLFFRKIGCEWLYRTIKQPERLKRIFPTLPLFLIKTILDSK